MAERERSRAQAAAGRAQTWRPPAAAARPAWLWPGLVAIPTRRAAGRLREWLTAEVGVGRLVPWLAVLFGCGVIVYFSTDREPATWAVAVLFAATVVIAVWLRHRPFGFPLALGAAATAF